MTDWQPIETAPRDGTVILVWLPKKSLASHVHSARLNSDGKPDIIGHHFVWDTGVPTHWQPLPAPPFGS